MNGKTIIMLFRRFYPHIGGVESQGELICDELIQRGYTIKVITKKYDSNLKDFEIYNGMKIYRFKNIFHLGLLLVRHSKEKNISGIFSHQLYEESLVLGILKFMKIIKIPVIGCTHSGGGKSEVMKIVNTFRFLKAYKLIYFFIFQFEYINCLNKDIKTQLQKYVIGDNQQLGNKLVFIPNGVKETEIIGKKRTDIKKFLFLGRFEREKGIFESIEAFKNIKNSGITLSIVGYGEKPIENKVKEKIKSDPRIKFVGKKTGKDKEEILKNCDVFLSPTYYPEGQSIALTEAMVNNLIIITTNTGNNYDLYGNEIYYVEKKDISSLQKNIEQLLKQEKKYNYDEIVKKINIQNTTHKYLKLINNEK